MWNKSSDIANRKGEQDCERSGGIARDPLTEIFHPTHNPPKGKESEYMAGWNNARKQSR
jgi:hypothetical protein